MCVRERSHYEVLNKFEMCQIRTDETKGVSGREEHHTQGETGEERRPGETGHVR